jgi:hypothetical protein
VYNSFLIENEVTIMPENISSSSTSPMLVEGSTIEGIIFSGEITPIPRELYSIQETFTGTITGNVGTGGSMDNIFFTSNLNNSVTIDRLVTTINTLQITDRIYAGIFSDPILFSESMNAYTGTILLSEAVRAYVDRIGDERTWHHHVLDNYTEVTEPPMNLIVPPNISCLIKKNIDIKRSIKINDIEISEAKINKLKDGQVILIKADSQSNVSFELEYKSIEVTDSKDYHYPDYSDNGGEGFGILIGDSESIEAC